MNPILLRWIARLAATLAAIVIGGCGVGPYDEGQADPADGDPAKDSLAGYGAEAPTQVRVDPRSVGLGIFDEELQVDRDAEKTAAVYGLTYANWSAQTYSKQHDRMAQLATGKQRRSLLSNPPDRQVIRGLAAGEQMNIARLVATDTVASGGAAKTVVVVMRERTAEEGLADPAPRHTVYLAKVVRTTAGWRVSSWTLLRT